MLPDADAAARTAIAVQPAAGHFLGVVQGSLDIASHSDLLAWLQGDVQSLLPHEILLVAWGDPGLDSFHIDVTSSLAEVRTQTIAGAAVQPFVRSLSDAWTAARHAPCHVHVQAAGRGPGEPGHLRGPGIERMHYALVHGIRNQRDDQLCLYVLLRAAPFPAAAPRHLEVLLPYIDAALRQIDHLPTQRGGGTDDGAPGPDDPALSGRENDILYWVAAGKTNEEIGMIMAISPFTVKNHLQRIFRKLGVSNRAQAVDRVLRHARPRTRPPGTRKARAAG